MLCDKDMGEVKGACFAGGPKPCVRCTRYTNLPFTICDACSIETSKCQKCQCRISTGANWLDRVNVALRAKLLLLTVSSARANCEREISSWRSQGRDPEAIIEEARIKCLVKERAAERKFQEYVKLLEAKLDLRLRRKQ